MLFAPRILSRDTIRRAQSTRREETDSSDSSDDDMEQSGDSDSDNIGAIVLDGVSEQEVEFED